MPAWAQLPFPYWPPVLAPGAMERFILASVDTHSHDYNQAWEAASEPSTHALCLNRSDFTDSESLAPGSTSAQGLLQGEAARGLLWGDAHRPVAALLCCAHPVTSCGAPCTGQRPPRVPSVLPAFPHSPNSCGTSIRGRTPVQRGNEADAGTVLVLGEIRVWPAEKQAQAPRVSKARRALRSYHGRGRGATAALSTSGASPWVVGSTDSLMQHWGFHGTSPKPSLRMTDDRRATVRD